LGDGLLTPNFSSSYLPPDVSSLAATFSDFSSYYSGAKSGIEIAQKFLQLIGVLNTPDPNAQYNQLQTVIEQTFAAVDWHNIMFFIDDQRGPAIWAMQSVAKLGGAVESGNEDAASGSSVNTIIGPLDSAFMRPYAAAPDGTDLVTKGRWTQHIKDRPTPDGQGLVYDWRLGVPAMLELIAIRLMVIGAMDHDFRWDGRYDPELRSMRDAVNRHYTRMVGGIRCVDWQASSSGASRPLGQENVCADIYTGIYARDSIFENGLSGVPVPNTAQRAVIQQRLRSQVLRALPLFAMRQMIDTLTLYLNHTQDFTETNQEMRLSGYGFKFCADVPYGDPTPLNALTLYGCHGGGPQNWIYDRPSGQVKNPSVGTCLDVSPTSEQLPSELHAVSGIANGAAVYSNTCNGSASQKWTYDPDAQTLQNGFAMFMYANAWAPADHSPIVAYQIDSQARPYINGNSVNTAKWQALQKTLGRRDALLWRHDDGTVVVWDTISGYRWQEHTVGYADQNWRLEATGDFNNDGHGDLLWRRFYDRALDIWQLHDVDVTSYLPATWNAPTTSSFPFSGDLDGDGVSDILWNDPYYPGQAGGTTSIWFMNPGSSEPRSSMTEQGVTNRLVAVGNFNGDSAHRADELWLDVNGTVSVELSGGGYGQAFIDPLVWDAKGVGDFNGDGTDDVLWYNSSDGRVARGIMSGGVQLWLSTLGTVPSNSGWSIQGVADVDHDGVSDIVWRHADGSVSYWILNADGSVRDYPGTWLPTNTTFGGVIKLGPPR
jgi:hypothetical protein